MSFKDQLLKAGLVNKKQVRKANQRARSERKKNQGSREAHAVVQERTRAERRAAQKQKQEQRLKDRRERDRAREAKEARRRVDQILNAHRVSFRTGQQAFWHRSPDGQHALRLLLPDSVAFDLHRGRLAIAYRGPADAFEPDIVLIPHDIAARVHKIDAQRILFQNTCRPTEPDEALL